MYRTRSQSRSLCSSPDPSETVSLSQSSGTPLSGESYFDSQDSLPGEEIDGKVKKSISTIISKSSIKSEHESHQRVIIAPDSLSYSKGDAQLLSIPHSSKDCPSSDNQRLYLVSGDKSVLYEMNKCSDDPRSWFIGNSVQTDGSLFVCTPVDPLFLILPLIIKSDKLFTTIDALLDFTSNHPHARLVADMVSDEQWLNICDRKVMADSVKVYRYNCEKTMVWLRKKVKLLSAHLKNEGVYVGTGSLTSGFFQSKKDAQIPEEEYLHYASGLIGEYLPSQLRDDLLAEYPSTNVKNRTKHKMDCTDIGDGPPLKKSTTNYSTTEPTEDYSKPLAQSNTNKPKVKPFKTTAKLKLLDKVDKKGMKSMNTFFKKS